MEARSWPSKGADAVRRALVALLAISITATGVACGTDDSADGRRNAVVYATIIRALVPPPADLEPGDPINTDVFVWGGEEHAIPLEVQARTVEELDNYTTIRFVDARGEAVDLGEPGEPIRNDGILITLGAVPPGSPITVRTTFETTETERTLNIRLEQDATGWRISSPSRLID